MVPAGAVVSLPSWLVNDGSSLAVWPCSTFTGLYDGVYWLLSSKFEPNLTPEAFHQLKWLIKLFKAFEAVVSFPSGTTAPLEKLLDPGSEAIAVKVTSLTPLAGVSSLTDPFIYSEPSLFQSPKSRYERKAYA